jgi:hypothetical protein
MFVGQRFLRGPRRALAQHLEGGLRAILGLAHHAYKISIANNRHKAGNAARAILSQLHKLCRRNFRSQDPAMQHSWQRLIVNETGMREYLVWNVHALNRASRQRAPRR